MNEKRRHRGRTVRKEIQIAARPEDVWNAWASSTGIARWFVDRADGDMRSGATVRWIFEHFGYDLPIEVFEAEPGRYLAFGGDAPDRPPALQEVFVTGEGGTTLLRLANSGFLDGAEWDEEYEGVDSGWAMALATLKYVLENGNTAPRTHLLAMQPIPCALADLQPFFDTEEGLGAWLANEVRLGDDPLRLETKVEFRSTGELPWEWKGSVLARTPTELLLGRSDGRATLGLKCFSMGRPPRRFVALDFNAWGHADVDAAAQQARLDAAVSQLAQRLSVAPGDAESPTRAGTTA